MHNLGQSRCWFSKAFPVAKQQLNILLIDVLNGGLHVKQLEDIRLVQDRSSPESPVPYIILHLYIIWTHSIKFSQPQNWTKNYPIRRNSNRKWAQKKTPTSPWLPTNFTFASMISTFERRIEVAFRWFYSSLCNEAMPSKVVWSIFGVDLYDKFWDQRKGSCGWFVFFHDIHIFRSVEDMLSVKTCNFLSLCLKWWHRETWILSFFWKDGPLSSGRLGW